MERDTILLILGVSLIIVAIILYGVSFSMGAEEVKTFKIPAGEERSYEINITGGNYTVIASFVGNVSYTLYYENGSVVESGVNESYVEMNITKSGRYTLFMKNLGDKEATASIIVAQNEKLLNGLYVIYISSTLCCTGSVIVIIALLLLLFKRRREEREYSYP